MTTDERLKRLENAKLKEAQLQGALESHLKRLNDEFGASTLEEAETRLKALEKAIEEDSKALLEAEKQLDVMVDWDKL